MSRLFGEKNILKHAIATRFRADLGRVHAELDDNSKDSNSCTNHLTHEIQFK